MKKIFSQNLGKITSMKQIKEKNLFIKHCSPLKILKYGKQLASNKKQGASISKRLKKTILLAKGLNKAQIKNELTHFQLKVY